MLFSLLTWKFTFRPLFFVLVFFSIGFSANGQQKDYFPYYSTDTTQLFQLATARKNAVKNSLVLPINATGDFRNNFKKITKNAADNIYHEFRHTTILDPLIYPYVKGVLKKVQAANPGTEGIEIYLSKNPEPNAFAMPDGSIFFNVSFLAKLETESQLAMIICHEIAHIKLKHLQTGLEKELSLIYSKEVKKKTKQIKRSKYNIYSKLDTLFTGVAMKNLYHDRAQETQADSLGFVYFCNTNYSVQQAFRKFEVMETTDEPESKEKVALAKYFSCSSHSFPFETVEPVKTKSIFNVKKTEDEEKLEKSDSLKTHPDSKKRKIYIENLSLKMAKKGGDVVNVPEFEQIRNISRYEFIQGLYDYKLFDHVFFHSLLFLEKEPENMYLRSMVFLSMFEMKKALEKHEFAEVMSTVSKYYPDNFNHLIGVVNTFALSDYGKFADCFNKSFPLKPTLNEYTLAGQYAYLQLIDRKLDADEVKKQYAAAYQNGKFTKVLKIRNLKKTNAY